ncbi:MAG: carbohydrate ABC transporter permease [Chloroflexi bacterium]|nr:carbohydrate ABC transporter permease [Chloroflexota bacterium]
MRRKITVKGFASITWLGLMLLLTFYPLFFLLNVSFKDIGQYTQGMLAITFPLHFENYGMAANMLKDYTLNSIIITVASLAGLLLTASLTAFVLARYSFPGRNIIFYGLIGLMMIPSVLTLIPSYILTIQIKIYNTHWAVILPYIAGGQAFNVFVLRTFFQGLPEELFEAARIDGASPLQMYGRIALPLSTPILSTLAIMHVLGSWNDYIWPATVLQSDILRTVAVGLVYLNRIGSFPDPGPSMAGSVLASIPLLLLFVLSMRTFMQGLLTGALKI